MGGPVPLDPRLTSRYCIKCLKSVCEIVFYCIWQPKFYNLYIKITVSPRCFIKETQNTSVLKNVSKFTDKHKKQSSRGVLSKENMFFKMLQKFTEKDLFRSIVFNKVADCKLETFRSSHCRCSVKQGALKKFANFTGNNLCWDLFLIKLHFWSLQLHKRRFRHRCFPVKFAIILKNIWECPLINFI